MHTLLVDPDSIFIGERHRALDEEGVVRLQRSIEEIGLKHPISIRVVDEMEIDGETVAGVPVLVTGRHRLEAVRRLKWPRVDCIEIEGDVLKAELWELAENLHRCDLTKEQRDAHIRRYAELLELQSQQSASIESKRADGRGHRSEGTASKIAAATGLSKDTVRRALSPSRPAPAPLTEEDAVERQVAVLMSAWNRAGPDARDQFLANIDLRIAA
jgi:ParB-like chromosome segregation protein Spo0J